jgi:hypothetical protein
MAWPPRSGTSLGSVFQQNLEALVDGPVAHRETSGMWHELASAQTSYGG